MNAAILIVAASVFFKRGCRNGNTTGTPSACSAARNHNRRRVVRRRPAMRGPVLNPNRNDGRADCDGGVPKLPHEALAAAADHANGSRYASRANNLCSTGEKGAYKLLILSQVILSMQLPFCCDPADPFHGDRKRMGSFTNPGWVRALAWLTA